jgi:hypothetical protein
MDVYDELRRRKRWVLDYFRTPRGRSRGRCQEYVIARYASRKLLEAALSTQLGDRLEAWEMQRKIRKLAQGMGPSSEASFGPEWCKGHFHHHQQQTMEAFAARVASLGTPPPRDAQKVRSWGEGARTVP